MSFLIFFEMLQLIMTTLYCPSNYPKLKEADGIFVANLEISFTRRGESHNNIQTVLRSSAKFILLLPLIVVFMGSLECSISKQA